MSQPKNLHTFIKEAESRAKENQEVTNTHVKVKDKSTFGLSFFKLYDILASCSEKNFTEKVADLKRKAKKDHHN